MEGPSGWLWESSGGLLGSIHGVYMGCFSLSSVGVPDWEPRAEPWETRLCGDEHGVILHKFQKKLWLAFLLFSGCHSSLSSGGFG